MTSGKSHNSKESEKEVLQSIPLSRSAPKVQFLFNLADKPTDYTTLTCDIAWGHKDEICEKYVL